MSSGPDTKRALINNSLLLSFFLWHCSSNCLFCHIMRNLALPYLIVLPRFRGVFII